MRPHDVFGYRPCNQKRHEEHPTNTQMRHHPQYRRGTNGRLECRMYFFSYHGTLVRTKKKIEYSFARAGCHHATQNRAFDFFSAAEIFTTAACGLGSNLFYSVAPPHSHGSNFLATLELLSLTGADHLFFLQRGGSERHTPHAPTLLLRFTSSRGEVKILVCLERPCRPSMKEPLSQPLSAPLSPDGSSGGSCHTYLWQGASKG
jgi:hypothetical protein